MNLAELQEGQTGIVREVSGAGPISHRLMDLGFLPGTEVKILRRAPFGDPTTFLIRGYRIGLRASEASIIKLLELP